MEDSFTNIFELAELNGLTWKKFSHTNPVPSLPSDDQVLSAYAKCMKELGSYFFCSGENSDG